MCIFDVLIFCHSSILRNLIAVTDHACDRGESMVSPVYVAINSDQTKSVELLLREGYSPDAQDCSHTHGLLSPLSLALYRTPQKPYRCVRMPILPPYLVIIYLFWFILHIFAR